MERITCNCGHIILAEKPEFYQPVIKVETFTKDEKEPDNSVEDTVKDEK